ncbi:MULTISPECIES: type I restriction-modification system subunit M [unclassified Synechococcus]|uniref:class I SAM-dependent DNA methyltransferase n=1 Tax=unclassified Synechococcus TaxID=2626047 RepID=UPI0021A3E5C5|nr:MULTISPECIES: type I restriction-modification system subunit M [unclassified Synechococcus]MCT0212783.1 type I restriction-modification system subunit M [Synechococcus sp. CS-1326]MCT0232615.1 type I restriction-modification system subunit M [Synechococcus sp. CS-1327]
MTYAAESPQSDAGTNDDLHDEFLGALEALGGSAGNGRLRETLEWDEASYEAVKADLLSRRLIVPGRGRGGSVALADWSAGEVSTNGQAANSAPSSRTLSPSGARAAAPSSFEQAFRAIDDCLRKEAGCGTELDYTEQTSWLLFLKYLDGLEDDKAAVAALEGRSTTPILDEPYRWNSWAAPKNASGQLDHHAALTGDDLRDFVNQRLFPYLERFKQSASGPNTIEYKIGEIFGELRNKISSGYNLREIIDVIDGLRFRSQAEKHELSMLYEEKIKRMGNAGRNGGEYYTPRPLIRAVIQVVNPLIGETVCDPAVGSAGFLCEAFDFMRSRGDLSTADLETLQTRTFIGKEKKSLAYVIAIMNMILHGIEAPNILHTNTLAENLADVEEKDRFDVIVANPPFGGKERKEVQQNFPIRTGETAFLFLQHFIRVLKAGGRAGIVIKNTFLSNTDNASVALRQKLLEECNLHTVLDCPGGTFQGAGVKTVVLFFEKGSPTRKVWFYQLDPGRNLGKTNPLNDADLAEFIALQKTKADSPKSWSVDVAAIDPNSFDLSVKNPNGSEEIAHRSPQEIMEEIAALDAESAEVLGKIKALL